MNVKELENLGGVQVVLTLADLREYSLALLAETVERPTTDDQLVPLCEAKKLPYISTSDATLGRWDKSGYLTKRKIGGKVYYRREDLTAIKNGK